MPYGFQDRQYAIFIASIAEYEELGESVTACSKYMSTDVNTAANNAGLCQDRRLLHDAMTLCRSGEDNV